jgi:hypothetical protein
VSPETIKPFAGGGGSGRGAMLGRFLAGAVFVVPAVVACGGVATASVSGSPEPITAAASSSAVAPDPTPSATPLPVPGGRQPGGKHPRSKRPGGWRPGGWKFERDDEGTRDTAGTAGGRNGVKEGGWGGGKEGGRSGPEGRSTEESEDRTVDDGPGGSNATVGGSRDRGAKKPATGWNRWS